MKIGEIKKFRNERRWVQLCDAIIAFASPESVNQLVEIFLECACQMHPKSSCEVFLHLSEILPHKEGIDLLTKGTEVLNSVVLYSENFDVEKALLGIKKGLILVSVGELKGIEKCLFEWKTLKMSKKMDMAYNYLGFRFYEKLQNIENAFSHLLRYAECSPGIYPDDMDALVRYAMLSETFFDFSKVTLLRGFGEMRNQKLKRVFLLFKDGDTKSLEEYAGEFSEMFGNGLCIVKEKMYMMALINLCSQETGKHVSIRKIGNVLDISWEQSMHIILRLFGFGLIKGWIDGEKGTLHFRSLLPGTLRMDDVPKIKDRFCFWKQRVHKVISMLK